jgi:hypothetical protein
MIKYTCLLLLLVVTCKAVAQTVDTFADDNFIYALAIDSAANCS